MNNPNHEEHFHDPVELEKKMKIGAEVSDQLTKQSRDMFVAIAGIESEKEGTVIGNGTIIELGGKILLVTAAHVISQIEKRGYRGVAYSNGHGKRYTPAPNAFKKDATHDVAFVQIPRPQEPESNRIPCPEKLIAESSKGVEKDLLFFQGIPGSYNKFLAISSGIHSTPLSYFAFPDTPKWPHFNPKIHFAFSFDTKFCRDPKGNEVTLPDAFGLSGTAVWNSRRAELGVGWKPDDARIAGIVQWWDQDGRCLIATRIESILPFLREG